MKVCPNCQTTLLVRIGIQPVPVALTTYINTNPAAPQKTTYCTHCCSEAMIEAVPITSIEHLQMEERRIRDEIRRRITPSSLGPGMQRPNEDPLWIAANARLKEGEALFNQENETKTAMKNQLAQFKITVAVQKKDIEKQIQEQVTWFVLLTTATPATWGHQVITTIDTICHAPFDDKLNLALQCIQLGGNALVDAKWLAYQGKAGNHSMVMATAIKVIPTATFKLDDKSVKAATELKRLYEL
jgi:hypothetical protein